MEQEFYDKMIGFYVTPSMNEEFTITCKRLSLNKSEILRKYVAEFIETNRE